MAASIELYRPLSKRKSVKNKSLRANFGSIFRIIVHRRHALLRRELGQISLPHEPRQIISSLANVPRLIRLLGHLLCDVLGGKQNPIVNRAHAAHGILDMLHVHIGNGGPILISPDILVTKLDNLRIMRHGLSNAAIEINLRHNDFPFCLKEGWRRGATGGCVSQAQQQKLEGAPLLRAEYLTFQR